MTKKPRKKKYNPRKQVDRALSVVARHCYLLRWDSKGAGTEFAFSSGGRYSDDQTIAALEHIMRQQKRWIVMVHACFIAGDDYYERGTMWVTDPVKLDGQADRVHGDIVNAVHEQRHAGNPKHYYDTTVIMRPLSDGAIALLDDDAWLEQQAAFRAEVVSHQAMIERLEAVA